MFNGACLKENILNKITTLVGDVKKEVGDVRKQVDKVDSDVIQYNTGLLGYKFLGHGFEASHSDVVYKSGTTLKECIEYCNIQRKSGGKAKKNYKIRTIFKTIKIQIFDLNLNIFCLFHKEKIVKIRVAHLFF